MAKEEKQYPTPEQIQEWSKQHGCYEYEIEGMRCWMRAPGLKILKAAFAQLSNSPTAFQGVLVESCFLAGDRQMLEDDESFFALAEEVQKLIDLKDYEISRSGNLVTITIGDYSCVLRRPTRVEIQKAEERNRKKQPFVTNQALLSQIWQSGDEILQKDDNYLVSLLAAVDELKTSKSAILKKSY